MPKMPLVQHLENADDLAIVCHHLELIFNRCVKFYPKSSKIVKILYNFMNSSMSQLKNDLDTDYHECIDEKEFKKLGHIYYNLDKRYKPPKKKLGKAEKA